MNEFLAAYTSCVQGDEPSLGEATKDIPATGYSISEDESGNVRQLKGL